MGGGERGGTTKYMVGDKLGRGVSIMMGRGGGGCIARAENNYLYHT